MMVMMEMDYKTDLKNVQDELFSNVEVCLGNIIFLHCFINVLSKYTVILLF